MIDSTTHGVPVGWALTGAKADERHALHDILTGTTGLVEPIVVYRVPLPPRRRTAPTGRHSRCTPEDCYVLVRVLMAWSAFWSQRTTVWLPCLTMRSSQCHNTARDSTARSTSAPRRVRSSMPWR